MAAKGSRNRVRLWLATVTTGAVLTLAGSAMAADMAVKAPPAMSIYNWTGCYIGAEGLGGWGLGWQTASSGPNSGLDLTPHYETSGWLAGGTVGGNYQVGNVVFGVEGDGESAARSD